MKSLKTLFPLLAVAGVTLLMVAFRMAADEKPDGAALFKAKCSMCHGADGKGFSAIKTPDFTDPKWQSSLKDKEITETIKNGKKGTPMVAFGEKLKEDEIESVVKYIRSLNSSKK